MSNKLKEKKHKIKSNNHRREKFLKPLITDEDFKGESDVFFSVVKNRTKTNIKKFDDGKEGSYYLSPMRGRVENRSTFPVTSSKGNIGQQYDFVRSDKKRKNEELKDQYGSEYYEFNLIDNQKRENIKDHMANKNNIESNNQDIKFTNINLELDNNDNKSYFEENRINIIYEEEIDIDDNKNVVTSYDENSNMQFYNDFEKQNINNEVDKFYSKVEVYEHDEKDGLRAELKKLFAEYEEEDKNKIYFKEDFDYEVKKAPEIKKTPTINKNNNNSFNSTNFVNLKEEVDKQIKNTDKIHPKTNDLEKYKFPSLELLNTGSNYIEDDTTWIEDQKQRLDATLESFGVAAKTVNYTQGPSVTRFEVEVEPGIKVSKITALQDDIKLRLAASDIRIEAPISGKSTVGIEVPNKQNRTVTIREILEANQYKSFKSSLKIALGLDITGEPIFSDISNMTHSLIAGSTGSGKSVCINNIIISILYNAMPDEVKLVLIDPKKVEFSMYKDIPHLLTPVINDPKIATASLKWLTEEMDRRYHMIEEVGARDIKSYNLKRNRATGNLPKLPYIVVIIDELADLMMVAANEVEEYIQRISQLARAAGIHLMIATQRPSTNVITGTIKTNIPTRISFKVSSAIDSRIILDDSGAEKLLGKGDMLLLDNGNPHLKRLQGSYISDEEIERVTGYVKQQLSPNYLFTQDDLVRKGNEFSLDYDDDLFDEVVRFVIDLGEASASRIQRQFKVGYNRAARIIDMMQKYNIIGPQQGGSKPRDVLMSLNEYEKMIYS